VTAVLAPDQGRRAPALTATALHSEPARKLEVLVGAAIAFLLTYNLPQFWTLLPPKEEGAVSAVVAPDAGGQMAAVLLLTAGFALASMSFDLEPILDLIRREPLLPMLMGLMVLSTLWSVDPTRTLRSSISMVAVTLVGYWLAARFTFASLMKVLSFAFALGTFVQYAFVFGAPTYGDGGERGWDGTFLDRNSLARSAVLGLVVFLLAARVLRRYRMLLYAFAIASMGLVLGATSKTALVGGISMPLAMLLYWGFRARRTLYGAVAIVIGGVATAAGLVVWSNIPYIAERLDRDVTFSGRDEIWKVVLDAIDVRPWFGFGWDAFWQGWQSPARMVWLYLDFEAAHAHNTLLDVALQIGVVGAAVLVALMVRLIVRGARVVRFVPGVAGLFPITFATMVVQYSVTEISVGKRDIYSLLLVVAVCWASFARRDDVYALQAGGRPA
jgi:O-antigen ligase